MIVQTDALPESHESVVVCQMTSALADAQDFRVEIQPSTRNGLRVVSQIMTDKPVTIRRTRMGQHIGQLDVLDQQRVDAALAFVVGLADRAG